MAVHLGLRMEDNSVLKKVPKPKSRLSVGLRVQVDSCPKVTVPWPVSTADRRGYPPPAPTAPALPFVYLGKYSEGNVQLVILSRGNRVLTAAQGDVIETNYRIERIEPAKVLFTYLPLGTAQSLATPP